MSNLDVKGLDEVLAVLSAFPAKLQRQAVKQGLTAAAAVIRDEARARAPKKTGKMAKAIKSGTPRSNPDGSWSISVRLDGRGNDHAFLGLFHEYGVKPHYIMAGDAGTSPRQLTRAAGREGSSNVADQALKIGGKFVTGAVLHPGHGARPFMRPALDMKAEDAVKAMAAKITFYVEGLTGFKAAA